MNLSMTKYRLEEQCHKGAGKRNYVTNEPVYDKVQVRGTMLQRCM